MILFCGIPHAMELRRILSGDLSTPKVVADEGLARRMEDKRKLILAQLARMKADRQGASIAPAPDQAAGRLGEQ
jgi:hypothetical protein